MNSSSATTTSATASRSGPHLRYYLLDRHGRRLACRDAWVGWPEGAYKKHLDLVVGQPRFLIFPWVRVHCLASKALSMAARGLAAAPRHATRAARNVRTLGVLPRDLLSRRQLAAHRPDQGPRRRRAQPQAPDADFVALWQDLIGALDAIAAEQDRRWQRRSRVLNTLLVMLFVFRLVFAHRQHSLHAVFRMRRNSGTAIDRFIASDQADTIVSILPSPEALRDRSRKHPGSSWQPVPLRLVKYNPRRDRVHPRHHLARPPPLSRG